MMNLIENEFGERKKLSITENGAVGYKSTDSALVDFNFKVSSFRNASEDEIIKEFDKAFHENKFYAMKLLFFIRDVRGGLGERRLFRICYRRLAELDIDLFYLNLTIISEYGRWDDLISLIGISEVTDKRIVTIINSQLVKDLSNIELGRPISLLGKWLPSENASSKTTKKLAKRIRKLMKTSPRKYRLMLSKLRKYLDVVEVKMCDNRWGSIDYEIVPSLANLKYGQAFLRHDEDRRRGYLDSLRKGETKMNMSVATPVDIVTKYTSSRWGVDVNDYDDTLELAWKNLKDVMVGSTLVVADGSGSMTMEVGSGRTTALDVANALAIYTSEHNNGVYKDKYITFSNTPQFVDLSNKHTLKGKIETALEHDEISNTNIEAVFNLILDVAVKNEISSDDMVKNILIISDMEFDHAQRGWGRSRNVLTKPLFQNIKEMFEEEGYQLPKLIFWNVNSRTGTIPLKENDLGVALVSGFSQNTLKMVMSGKLNPYEVLIEMLDNPRYDKVKVG